MKNSVRGELVEPCELSVSAVKTVSPSYANFAFPIVLSVSKDAANSNFLRGTL